MNVLIDVGHPAHVHYFRFLAIELQDKGHNVFWTVKDIPVAKNLLDYYKFKYIVFPKKPDSIIKKAIKQLQFDLKLWNICKQKKIKIAIGSSVSIAHVSHISAVKSIVFDDDDDEIQPLVTKYLHPYTDTLITPSALKGRRKRKDTIYYPGYQELAYLHPNRFTPDPAVLNEVGVKQEDKFFIMRFNVFKAHHDVGINGLNLKQKKKLIEILKPHGKIFITTEREIEPELKEYQLPISPEKIHSLMAHAYVFLGDSQTMTTEAAILGTPALKCNSFAGKLSVHNELENYGLCYSFLPIDFEKLLVKLQELLAMPNLKEEWQSRRQKMLADKIDVTAFMVWFIENYPESAKIMKENPDYQYRFK